MPADTEACARIFFDAFAAIAGANSFPCEPGSPEVTRQRTAWLLARPACYGVVADHDGRAAIAGRGVRAATTADLKPARGSAPAYTASTGPERCRTPSVLQRCLARGLRVQTSTLMSLGDYREPTGAWLPSILF